MGTRDWSNVELGALALPAPNSFVLGPFGSNLKKADYRDSGVPVVFVRDIKPASFRYVSNVYLTETKAAELAAHNVQANDLVITKMGLPPGITALYPKNMPAGVVTADIIRLRPDAARSCSEFLVQALNSAQVAEEVRKITAGQTRPKLTLKDYKKVVLALPPLPEQRKIAAILSSVDEAIEKTQAVIDQVQVVKKGLMQELLTRGLPGRHTRFKQTEIGEVPEEWALTSVPQVANPDRSPIQTGPFGAQLGNEDFVDTGVPVLKIGNVQWSRLDLGKLDHVSEEKAAQLARFRILPGDLLFARQGATTGRNALVTPECQGWLINYHIIRVCVDHSVCRPGYLSMCFNSDLVQRQVMRNRERGNRPGINSKDIASFRFPLPPADEQDKFVAIMDGCAERVSRETGKVDALRQLKAGLMSVLLTGEVRVHVEEDAA